MFHINITNLNVLSDIQTLSKQIHQLSVNTSTSGILETSISLFVAQNLMIETKETSGSTYKGIVTSGFA